MLEIGGETPIFTHDAMAEGTHFRADADMADVAWKLVASNLSDLAAKGAEPVGILLSYALGRDDERFVAGLREALEEYRVPLMGGDTISATGASCFGLTAIGRATHTPVPDRSGSQAGDAIYVTGMVGRAMLGFEGVFEHRASYDRPRPLLSEGRALAPLVTAMMDVSDGLLLDAWRMGQASDLSFEITSDLVPVADPDRRCECLRWGDDYELLFTASPETVLPVAATRIATVAEDDRSPMRLDGELIADPENLGYTHS